MTNVYVQEALSVAPMMDCTDKHWRMLVRGITEKTVLYTEMAVDGTLLHQDRYMDFSIGKDICEHPSVIQLGGSDPAILARCCTVINEFNCATGVPLYQEINLNCGCPSARVAQRSFGARLMLDPDGVREIVYSMARTSSVPVTVKCRLGADEKDSYNELCHFIATVAAAGVTKFIVHARKCLLSGLTTKQNRDVPPLRYEVVHRLARDFPSLEFIINGGIRTLAEGKRHLVGRYPIPPRAPTVEAALGLAVATATADSGTGTGTGRASVMASVFSDLGPASAAVESVFSPAASGACDRDCCGCVEVELDEEDAFRDLHSSADRVTGADTDADGELDLPPVHGAMIGRAAFNDPLLLARADSTFFGAKDPNPTRREIIMRYAEYCEAMISEETGLSRRGSDGKVERVTSSSVLKPVTRLMNGLPGGHAYRMEVNDKYLALLRDSKQRMGTCVSTRHNPSPRAVLESAMEKMRDDLLDLPVADSCTLDCWGRLVERHEDR